MEVEETKTVSSDMDLYVNQCKDVASMRSSLLSFNKNDPNAARKALQNITILRVYHQISSIIRYTELMDEIEDKMYSSIRMDMQSMDELDPMTWRTLLSLQEKLQKNMIESHKLLEPYLNPELFASIEVSQPEDPQDTFASIIIDQQSREKIRSSAQAVLSVLSSEKGESVDESSTGDNSD